MLVQFAVFAKRQLGNPEQVEPVDRAANLPRFGHLGNGIWPYRRLDGRGQALEHPLAGPVGAVNQPPLLPAASWPHLGARAGHNRVADTTPEKGYESQPFAELDRAAAEVGAKAAGAPPVDDFNYHVSRRG